MAVEPELQDDYVSDADSNDATPDALHWNDKPWQYRQPKSQPLSYWVRADAHDGKTLKKIGFNVDFNNKADIEKANKRRDQGVRRRAAKYGFLPKRPSTIGCEYSGLNNDMISAIHEDYAMQYDGRRIPWGELTDRYNQIFPAESRTVNSITSQVNREPELRALRNSYQQ